MFVAKIAKLAVFLRCEMAHIFLSLSFVRFLSLILFSLFLSHQLSITAITNHQRWASVSS